MIDLTNLQGVMMKAQSLKKGRRENWEGVHSTHLAQAGHH
jgi:hypothetical protein